MQSSNSSSNNKDASIKSLLLNSISIDILVTIYWSKDESISDPVLCNNLSSNCSKSTSTSTSTYTSHDNPPILPSLYPILDSLDSNTSNLKEKHSDVIVFKYFFI